MIKEQKGHWISQELPITHEKKTKKPKNKVRPRVMFLLLQPGRMCMKLSKNGQKGACKDGWSRHSDGRIKLESGGTRRQGQKAEKLNSWKREVFWGMPPTYYGCSAFLVNSVFAKTGSAETYTIQPYTLRAPKWQQMSTCAFWSPVTFWFPENELRDGRFQCSGRLIWTATAMQPHWPLLLAFTWGEK